MSMWTAIALISVAGIIAGIFDNNKKGKSRNEATSEELKALHDRLDSLDRDLRTRVETLERIVTSPQDNLKRQFDHLDKAS